MAESERLPTATKKNREPYDQMPVWLRQRLDVGPGPKLLWACLAGYARMNGEACPGTRRLADDLGVHNSRVQAWTETLKRAGLLQVESARGKGRRANRYVVLTPPDGDGSAPDTRALRQDGSAPITGAQTTRSAPDTGAQTARSAPVSAPVLKPVAPGFSSRSARETGAKQKQISKQTTEAAAPLSSGLQTMRKDSPQTEDTLTRAGVNPTTAQKLSGQPDIGLAFVEDLIGKGHRGGALVNQIREGAAADAEARDRQLIRLKLRAEEQARADKQRADERLARRRHGFGQQIIDQADEADIVHAEAPIIDALTPRARKFYRRLLYVVPIAERLKPGCIDELLRAEDGHLAEERAKAEAAKAEAETKAKAEQIKADTRAAEQQASWARGDVGKVKVG